MRRSINTISKEEYDALMNEACARMRTRILRLIDDEESKVRFFEDREDFKKAEMHDFNSRALQTAFNALCIVNK